eukprot:3123675-Rhodomonas_salina.1
MSSPLSGTPPSIRLGLGMAALDGKVFVFGGYLAGTSRLSRSDSPMREEVLLSKASMVQQPCQLRRNFSLFTAEIAGECHSRGHVWSLSPLIQCWVRGQTGCPSCFGELSDLHEYEPNSKAWVDLSTPSSGAAPAARYNHGFAAAGTALFAFAGFGRLPGAAFASQINDLHRYEPATSGWTELTGTTSGTTPEARWRFGFTELGGDLYVFGGAT